MRATAVERLFPLFRRHFSTKGALDAAEVNSRCFHPRPNSAGTLFFFFSACPPPPPPLVGVAVDATLFGRPYCPPYPQAELSQTAPGPPPPPGRLGGTAATGVGNYAWRDLFLVKYSAAEGGQRAVGLHRDGSSLR